MKPRERRHNLRTSRVTAATVTALATALAIALLGVAGLAAEASAATPLETQTTCDDDRLWTRDVATESGCSYVNLCVLNDVQLTTSEALKWEWTFSSQCPDGAVDALGVTLTRELYTQSIGPLSIEPMIETRIEHYGTPKPARVGSGSVSLPCGRAQLHFVVLAGGEVIATADGNAVRPPCDSADVSTTPVGMLGAWTNSQGQAAAMARLYWTTFGRLPDMDGFSYWMAKSTAGMSIRRTAAIWTGLGEWQATYAATSDEHFVNKVYENVLGRRPEAAGLDYWMGRLQKGLRRSDLVANFSDSAEFKQRTRTA